jgi:copper chaperone CopZ
LRESKWGAPKFQEYIHAVGMTPANDLKAIERAIKGVYGVDLKEMEAKWVDYCKKR